MVSVIEYLVQLGQLVEGLKTKEQFITRLVDEIVARAIAGRQIIVFGNGGSAATASHFVCDLCNSSGANGRPQVKGLCLSDNTPMFTARANDDSYDTVFAQQLNIYCDPDDLVIAISGSGNSSNVIKGVETAKSKNAICFGLCGFNGGQLAKLADEAIIIPGQNIQQAEDVHLVILHLVALLVKERLKG
jgi:D-sedoheptulose 7-phosphate isomerase